MSCKKKRIEWNLSNNGLWFFICWLCICFVPIQSQELKNPDNPCKGTWSFSQQRVWETDSAGTDILVNIQGIQIDDHGNIYVLNSRLNKVHVFNSQGSFLYSFAKMGEGPGEIKQSWALFLVENQIIVADNGKIHYFSPQGEYLESIATTELIVPYLFVDVHRVLAIPFSSLRHDHPGVELFDLKNKTKEEVFQIPKIQAFRYQNKGVRLILRMPFEAAENLLITRSQSDIWYGYSNTYRINRLDLPKKGETGFTIAGRDREMISNPFKVELLENVTASYKQVPKKILGKMVKQLPDQMPYFHHLFADNSGKIYALIASSKHPHRRYVDIFSPQGKYLYRGNLDLAVGCRFIWIAMKQSDLVVFVEDAEGEIKLVKFTIKIPE